MSRFIRLTDTEGRPLFVRPESVGAITPPFRHHGGMGCCLYIEDRSIDVEEKGDEVLRLVDEALARNGAPVLDPADMGYARDILASLKEHRWYSRAEALERIFAAFGITL